MPIILDGQTPYGRRVEYRKTFDGTGPCRTRQMTAAERERYGLPNGPDKWEKPPVFASLSEEPLKKKAPKNRAIPRDPEFGKRVRKERLAKGMSMKDFAGLIGCSISTVGNIENAGYGVKYTMRKKICDVFGWEVAE